MRRRIARPSPYRLYKRIVLYTEKKDLKPEKEDQKSGKG